MDQTANPVPQREPIKRPKATLTPEQIAEREQALKILQERRAAQAARVEEIRRNAEAKKANGFVKSPNSLLNDNTEGEDASKTAVPANAVQAVTTDEIRTEEDLRKEEILKAEEERLEQEAKAAEQERLAEAARALEEAKEAERARLEAEEAAKAAAAAKAEAEAKLAEAQKAIKAAEDAREIKAERVKMQSKTSEFFKSAIATSDKTIKPGISAIASEEGYDKSLENRSEHKPIPDTKTKNPYGTFKSGASSGVGASASKATSGPSISAERAKASSNSNQLGSLLAGRNLNSSGRAPVWAAPGSNISAFKESDEAREARLREEQRRVEEEEARKRSEELAKASYTSIADSARTRKSAFFKRAPSNRDTNNNEQEEHVSAYGGIVRPSAIVDEERDIKKKMTAPAMGAALEGQRPSIMDPNSKAAPTAFKPMAGFKGIGTEESKRPSSPFSRGLSSEDDSGNQ